MKYFTEEEFLNYYDLKNINFDNMIEDNFYDYISSDIENYHYVKFNQLHYIVKNTKPPSIYNDFIHLTVLCALQNSHYAFVYYVLTSYISLEQIYMIFEDHIDIFIEQIANSMSKHRNEDPPYESNDIKCMNLIIYIYENSTLSKTIKKEFIGYMYQYKKSIINNTHYEDESMNYTEEDIIKEEEFIRTHNIHTPTTNSDF